MASRGEVDLRLIVNAELAALQPLAQLVLEPEQLAQLVCHVRPEHLAVAAAASLRRVHRDVGAPDELFAGAGPAGVDGDADAGVEHEVAPADRHRLAEPFDVPMGDRDAFASLAPSSSTANSSPPRRARVSLGRVTSPKRCASCWSRLSPLL